MPSRRWLKLTTLFFAVFAFLFSLQVAPPLIPAIIKEFNLSHTSVAGLMLFVALPAMFLSIPGGLLADKYGNKRLSTIGLALVCLGTFLTAIAPSVALVQGSRAIVGIGGALLLTAAPPMLFLWFSGKQLGFAVGIFAINMPLATVLSFNLLGRVEIVYGWRAGFWIAAVLAVIALILFTIFIKEKNVARTSFSLAALKRAPIWVLAFAWGSFNVAVLSLTTWGKTLFMDFKGVPPVQADFLASLVMLLAFITPLTGYLAGRLGRRRPLIVLSMVGMTVSLALLPGVGNVSVVVLLILLGLFAAFTPPCIITLPPELVGQENAGLGFGILNATLNLAVVIGPLLVGLVLDITHSEVIVFGTLAFFAALGAFLAYTLKVR